MPSPPALSPTAITRIALILAASVAAAFTLALVAPFPALAADRLPTLGFFGAIVGLQIFAIAFIAAALRPAPINARRALGDLARSSSLGLIAGVLATVGLATDSSSAFVIVCCAIAATGAAAA